MESTCQTEQIVITVHSVEMKVLGHTVPVDVPRNSEAPRRRGGGVLPYKRLMWMCRWIGSHFHDWMDYNGVAFSKELLEWGHTFSDFWGKKDLHICG